MPMCQRSNNTLCIEKTLNVRVSTTQLGLLPPAIRSVLDGTELTLFCCFLQFFFSFTRSQWMSFCVYSIPTNEQTNEKQKPSAEWIKLCNLASRKWTAVKASIHLVMVTDFVESLAFFLFLSVESSRRGTQTKPRQRLCEWISFTPLGLKSAVYLFSKTANADLRLAYFSCFAYIFHAQKTLD